MKKLIIYIFILLCIRTFAQSPELNHEKYWHYRYRMNNYFTSSGPNIYQSLVSARRNTNMGNDIYFGDQTIDMGWYMAVVAMEYYMLSSYDNEEDKSFALTDLYYLLEAFERLDYFESKVNYLGNPPSLLDGFFARKDPEMFEETIPYSTVTELMNNNLSPSDDYGTQPPGHPTYSNNLDDGDGLIEAYEMSQDQIIHLLIGFATIKRVFNDMRYPIDFFNYITNEPESFNFYESIQNNTDNIARYIRNLNLDHGPDIWSIFRPTRFPVYRGYDCKTYSHGLVKAFNWITDNDYSELYSLSVGKPIWETLGRDVNPTIMNNVMELTLASIGNSWVMREHPNNIFEEKEPTDYWIFYKSDIHQHDLFHIMLYEFLHEKESPYEREVLIESILNTAPFCGPYRYNQTECYEYNGTQISPFPEGYMGWASHNRYRRTIDEANGDHSERGNFPGLDYMVTYNLYRILRGGAPYRNMINSYLDQPYPYQQNGNWYGTKSNPANLRAFETFECNNEIETNTNGDGSLNLIASNSIKLTPGFHVYQGAHFSAKIEEYDCWEAGGNGNNKSSYFHDNGYVYNYNPNPMEVLEDEITDLSDAEFKDEILENTLLVFPNPAKNQIQFQFENANISSYQLLIRDVYGNSIISEPNYHSSAVLNISTLSNGIYFAEVVIDGRVYQEKFVVL